MHLVYESAAPNNGMHPTRDTLPVINLRVEGGRVMPGVRLLMRYSPLLIESAGAAGDEAKCLKRRRPC